MGERRAAYNKKAPPKAKWPVLQPKLNLQITRLKDNDLFTVQNFFTPAESKAFIKAAESAGFEHQGSLGPAKGEAYRDNDRIAVNDPALADMYLPCNQYYTSRYKVGQHFGRHIDESVDLGEGKHTVYTLLVYLSGAAKTKDKSDSSNTKDSASEPIVGGETVFYGSRNRVVAPAEGMALLHIHGDKCMLHEARNVSKGIKYVFRSDVVFA
ncbi:hypothetical protein GOBAR_AA17199 [Gossypium barbadense]|uniref:Fe2OG dioxygenase domain-containing protein n=1 Tax=Gossypium barbadense TaxID=3634 RepID=A0A2P5XJC3_GOSBA|nr:hypothetical protein GOBAR_AA17199 [Gossypium barbadense]